MTEEMEFEALERLDLRKCRTVGEIVAGMQKCSFGARMLGEVAEILTGWATRDPSASVIVYDGFLETQLGRLLNQMVARGWFFRLASPANYAAAPSGRNLLVVGPFSERYADAIYENPERAIFVNDFGIAKPGQIRDGFFPDAVFADPRFAMPVIAAALDERMGKEPFGMAKLLERLPLFDGVASEVASGAETLSAMVEDPDCTVFLTMSGAMTIAKMGLVICDMIDMGMVQAITSTGALMAHGLIEAVGLPHYKYNPEFSDVELAERKLNRVTDSLEPEENFTHINEILHEVLEQIPDGAVIGPSDFHALVGDRLIEAYPNERGVLKSAREKDIPVFVPAFVDSELGNDVYVHNVWRERQGRQRIIVDPELDSRKLVALVTEAKRIGIFSIGGGVPRNNAQNVAPLIEIINARLGLGLPERQFLYGCRICPDRMYYGHLSGCTYSENASWRKMDIEHGSFAEVHGDATQIWPFLVRYVMDRRERAA